VELLFQGPINGGLIAVPPPIIFPDSILEKENFSIIGSITGAQIQGAVIIDSLIDNATLIILDKDGVPIIGNSTVVTSTVSIPTIQLTGSIYQIGN